MRKASVLVGVVIISAALGVGLPVLGPRPVAAQEPSADPVAVVQAFIQAANDEQVAMAAAMFADDATYIFPSPSSPCQRLSPCTSQPEIIAGLEYNRTTHLCITPLEWTSYGSVVIVYAEGRNDLLRRNGIERAIVIQMYNVADGKIAAAYNVNDRDDADTAANAAMNAGIEPRRDPIPNPPTPCG